MATVGSPALLAQLVEHLHGKEGVDGSSPSEGFSDSPANHAFRSGSSLNVQQSGCYCGTMVAEALLFEVFGSN